MIPQGTARPCGFVAASTSAHVAPPPTLAVFASASTETEFISERSATTPSSTLPSPPPLCPPPRTASGRSCVRANPITLATSPVLEHFAITDGFLSIIALNMVRSSS